MRPLPLLAFTSLVLLFSGCPSGEAEGEADCVGDDCAGPAPGCVGATCQEPQPGDCGDDDDCEPAGGGTSTGGTAGGTPGGKPPTGNQEPKPSPNASIVGEWVYSGASYPREDGSMAELTIAGDLSLRANGTWEHYRRIGNVGASGEGTYTIAGNRITLKHDDGSSDLVYDFYVGTHTDADTGESFKALTFNFVDGSGFRYLLVENK